uniref:Translocase of outer mitochondrial membrane 34 n=1 Tax=Apteryx owenii TaxID=8824 RepID=A0A8B9P7Q4_APTOW
PRETSERGRSQLRGGALSYRHATARPPGTVTGAALALRPRRGQRYFSFCISVSSGLRSPGAALELVPFGIKPLLRRAAAYEALERYQLAYVDYKTVLQIDCTIQSAHDGVNRMTKVLEKDGVNWRKKLPPIPTVPISAQTRWSVPSAGGLTSPCETVPLGKADQTAASTGRARTLKEEGNELVKKGNHKKAIEKYSESLKLKQECATYTNRALCYLTLKQYKEAVQDCTEALRLEPNNVKAFYRRAQALKELKDYKSSIADINSLLKTEPKNTAALRLLQELNRA